MKRFEIKRQRVKEKKSEGRMVEKNIKKG